MEGLGKDFRPELVFGLVGGAGTRLGDLEKELQAALKNFEYKGIVVRLSDLLEEGFKGWVASAEGGEFAREFTRITHLQRMGNAFREGLDPSALALAAIAKIRELRKDISGDADTPASAHAYILHQLKNPAEVDLLRAVYGPSFILIGAHSPEPLRMGELCRVMARKESKEGQDQKFQSRALEVIEIDEKQDEEHGQNTRDTYPLADFFANVGIDKGEHAVRRFVDLLFGHPFKTPSPDEYFMYQAGAASLRSSDDMRQVGAVIVNITPGDAGGPTSTDIIAVGMNEVPRAGGGFYWDGASPDGRDQYLAAKGDDRARGLKTSILAELIVKMRDTGWLIEAAIKEKSSVLAEKLLGDLKRTQFMDIGEFSRPVHAEMAALLDAARRGVAINGHSMYVTTFPCHNCAKHIIAAGLPRVVYLEPYPKSRANAMYHEELSLHSATCKAEEGKVVFCAYTGDRTSAIPPVVLDECAWGQEGQVYCQLGIG